MQLFLTPRGYAAMGLTYAELARQKLGTPEDRAEAVGWLEKSLVAWRETQADAALPWLRSEIEKARNGHKAGGFMPPFLLLKLS